MKRQYNWESSSDSDEQYESLDAEVKRVFQNIAKKYGRGVTTRRQAQKLMSEEKTNVDKKVAQNENVDFSQSMDFDDGETFPQQEASTSQSIPQNQNVESEKEKEELAAAYMSPNVKEQPPTVDPHIFDQDAVVAENNFVTAHVYKAFHQHQKIFR